MIRVTKDIHEAKFCTHSGDCHGPDVMTTVILSKIFPEVVVYRAPSLPKELDSEVIVYDLKGGQFEGRPKKGYTYRGSGIPYATCGTIWNKYRERLIRDVCYSNKVWHMIDCDLIQGIDAVQVGIVSRTSKEVLRNMDISQAIFDFNLTWDSDGDTDEAFLRAVAFAEVVFDNVLKKSISTVKAKDIIEEAIEKSENHILVLEQAVPWKKYIYTPSNKKAKEIQFVVYPCKREQGYNWRGVNVTSESYELRKNIPREWRGLEDEELQRVTGVATATFCHSSGFIGGAKTLEDAIAMARIAVESR